MDDKKISICTRDYDKTYMKCHNCNSIFLLNGDINWRMVHPISDNIDKYVKCCNKPRLIYEFSDIKRSDYIVDVSQLMLFILC
jgi:hypothetical protein